MVGDGTLIFILITLAVVSTAPLVCQAFLYWKVVVTGRDRNHIDGMAILIFGLIPIIGLIPLRETYNKDRQPRPQPEPGSPSLRVVPPPENKVYTVQQRRGKLHIDPADVLDDYLDGLPNMDLDDLNIIDS